MFSEALEGALGANVRLEEALGSRLHTPDLGKLVTVQKPSSFGAAISPPGANREKRRGQHWRIPALGGNRPRTLLRHFLALRVTV